MFGRNDNSAQMPECFTESDLSTVAKRLCISGLSFAIRSNTSCEHFVCFAQSIGCLILKRVYADAMSTRSGHHL